MTSAAHTVALPTDIASDPASADPYAVLDMPVYKDEALGHWLFAYVGLIDTICAGSPPAVLHRGFGKAEVVFADIGGRIVLSLHLETEAAGAVTDFEVATLTAHPRMPMLKHLRFDLEELENPLIGLTHSLLRIIELKRAPILAALNAGPGAEA
jgi:hypothetical protein